MDSYAQVGHCTFPAHHRVVNIYSGGIQSVGEGNSLTFCWINRDFPLVKPFLQLIDMGLMIFAECDRVVGSAQQGRAICKQGQCGGVMTRNGVHVNVEQRLADDGPLRDATPNGIGVRLLLTLILNERWLR